MKHGFGVWFAGIHLGGGVAVQQPGAVLVVGFEAVHLCWKHIYWSVFEAFAGIYFRRPSECQNECHPRWEFLTAGTRLGYPLLLGPKKRHELRFGVGFAYASLSNLDAPSINSFVLIPGVRYQISAFIASLQIILPTLYDRSHRYPASLFLTVGISLRDLNHI